jgi:PleD family two-component response regulator
MWVAPGVSITRTVYLIGRPQTPSEDISRFRPRSPAARVVLRELPRGCDAATPAGSIVRVNTGRTRVALADDDVLLREGLASLLERSGFDVVGQCAEASELIALVREHQPDLVLVDIRMPPTHSTEGLDAARA